MKLGVRALEDPDPKVREVAVRMLTTLVDVSSKKNPGKDHKALVNMLDEVKTSNAKLYRKIMEGGEGATDSESVGGSVASAPRGNSKPTTSTATGASAAPARPGLGNKMVRKGSTASTGSGPTTARPPSRAKPPSSSSSSARSAGGARTGNGGGEGGGGMKAAADAGDEDVDVTLGVEEAMERLGGLGIAGWENEILPMLGGTKWQDRKAALSSIRQHLEGMGSNIPSDIVAVVVVFLNEQTKKFKDSNVNIVKEAMEMVNATIKLVEHPSPSDRAALAMLIPIFTDRLTDRKIKDISVQFLTSVAELLTPAFVARRVIKFTATAKAPAQHVESQVWLKTCVMEFGSGCVPVQAMAQFCVTEVENSNAAIRKAAIETLGTMYQQVRVVH